MNIIAGDAKVWSYEQLCDLCREMVGEMDNYRWVIGDSALEIEGRYGEHTAEDFAKDIGQNLSTVKGWKRVAKFYPEKFRAKLIQDCPNLTYTYYRDALRLGDLQRAIAWLQDASDFGYTADESARKLTEYLGHKVYDHYEGEIESSNGMRVTIYVEKGTEWKIGQKVTIKIRE